MRPRSPENATAAHRRRTGHDPRRIPLRPIASQDRARTLRRIAPQDRARTLRRIAPQDHARTLRRTASQDEPRTLRRTRPHLILALIAALLTPLAAALPAEAADYPTWEEVQAARGNEQSKQKQIRQITALVSRLQQATVDATQRAEKAGRDYQVAQDALDLASSTYDTLAAGVTKARGEADESGAAVGQIAAALARPGGADLTAKVVFGQGDPRDFLQGLSMSSKLGEQIDDLYARATAQAKTAAGLSDQAERAKTARTALAAKAQVALAEAAEAGRAAVAAEESERDNLGVMNAQLATLRDDRLSIEDGYQDGVRARAAAAAAAAKAAAEARARQAAAAAAAAANRPSPPATGSPGTPGPPSQGGSGWTRPITSYSFYQAYGYRLHPVYHDYRLHTGADFSAGCGTPIYATAAGTVAYAGAAGNYGNIVIVDHGNGITSAYAHVFSSGIYVRAGQSVAKGQNIAGVGTAGVSTGCHLHFEIRRGGVATDPMAFLAGRGVG